MQALSTEVGFPRAIAARIATQAVVDGINYNSTAFDVIELFVKKDFEFKLYKKLLEELLKEREEILSEVEELILCEGVWS